MTTTVMNVQGMTCNHCVMSVKGAVKGISGVHDVEVDLSSGKVTVQFEGDESEKLNQFKDAIEEQGYDVVN